MKLRTDRRELRYLEAGRRRRRQLPRASGWLLVLGLVALVLSAALFVQASARGAGQECRHGAISAIGPVDAQGRGDTTAEVRCLEP